MSGSDANTRSTWLVGAALAVPVLGAGLYWLSWKSYQVIPVQYQYIPGTMTGWLAHMLSEHSAWRRKQRPIRVYMDGCFDMMHYGHANALRQAKKLGDELVVGLIPDSEIIRCKGPPVMSEAERAIMVGCVKWVDEVVTGVPYDLTPEFMYELFEKHKIDYVIHGDDPCLLPDGTDAYAHAKKIGRFRMIKRTQGVSTTDIVGRMLMCAKREFTPDSKHVEQQERLAREFSREVSSTSGVEEEAASSAAGGATRISRFMPTSHRLVQFSSGQAARPGARIVYMDGAFDVFHCGHVKILEQARKLGDFLLVGVHEDETVSARRGPHLPIMGLHERALSVLACKHADEVVIGAPGEVTADLIRTFNIDLVVRGDISEAGHLQDTEKARYSVPMEMGIFKEIKSKQSMTTSTIIGRIWDNKKAFEKRQSTKVKSEAQYYKSQKEIIHEA